MVMKRRRRGRRRMRVVVTRALLIHITYWFALPV
jgi:hypothetical protein